MGGIMAMLLLGQQRRLSGPVTVVVDSQPAIRATRNTTSTPSHWIWDLWHKYARALARRHPNIQVNIRWAPGHVDIEGNERADEEAKKAAQDGDSSEHLPEPLRGRLPWSKSAARQAFNAELKATVTREWGRSTRYTRTMQYDAKLTNGSYIALAERLPRSLTVLLLQLRTGHVPLAKHLHKIGKADSPVCPGCRLADETVGHYLLHCPAHRDARRELRRAGGPQTEVISKLLGIPELLPHLFKYLGRTGRFHTVHGDLPHPPDLGRPAPRETIDFLINFNWPEKHPRTAAPLDAQPN
ncbi:RNase H domain-containing protein [Mycena venus]|uniref:RNase H domain-containing protein n=1 Tax=Mycena venus TaxID=2733690 RepID=A0A8H6X3F7_9AGAR|nr:RNase H domain-containing protein [Mycena venus]